MILKNIEYAKNLFSKIPRPKPKTYFVRGDLSKLIFPNYDVGLTEANKMNLQSFLPSQNTFDVVSIQFAFTLLFSRMRLHLELCYKMLQITWKLMVILLEHVLYGKRVFNKLKGRKKIRRKS